MSLMETEQISHIKEAARAWELIDVIREAWDKETSELPTYAARTMGPKAAFDLLEKMVTNGLGNLIYGIKNVVTTINK